MNGVEILNQTNVYQQDGCEWLFWLTIGVGFLVGLVYVITQCVQYGVDGDDFVVLAVFTLIGAFCGIISFVISMHDTDELKHVEYKVTISDEVNLNEFMDKYEILDQEGKIYTIKEKG